MKILKGISVEQLIDEYQSLQEDHAALTTAFKELQNRRDSLAARCCYLEHAKEGYEKEVKTLADRVVKANQCAEARSRYADKAYEAQKKAEEYGEWLTKAFIYISLLGIACLIVMILALTNVI